MLQVNGKNWPNCPATLGQLVQDMQLEGRVVVLHNQQVYTLKQCADQPLNHGDHIEIVAMLQGG